MATPLFSVDLKEESIDVYLCTLGMEAEAAVKYLYRLMQDTEVDIEEKVETRYGTHILPHVFAKMGHVRLL